MIRPLFPLMNTSPYRLAITPFTCSKFCLLQGNVHIHRGMTKFLTYKLRQICLSYPGIDPHLKSAEQWPSSRLGEPAWDWEGPGGHRLYALYVHFFGAHSVHGHEHRIGLTLLWHLWDRKPDRGITSPNVLCVMQRTIGTYADTGNRFTLIFIYGSWNNPDPAYADTELELLKVSMCKAWSWSYGRPTADFSSPPYSTTLSRRLVSQSGGQALTEYLDWRYSQVLDCMASVTVTNSVVLLVLLIFSEFFAIIEGQYASDYPSPIPVIIKSPYFNFWLASDSNITTPGGRWPVFYSGVVRRNCCMLGEPTWRIL